MIIYKATNKINSKCYVGKTIKTLAQRKAAHVYEAKNNRNDFVFYKVKNIVKWCKENNYPYQKARWRIRKGIDLSLGNLRGKWCRN